MIAFITSDSTLVPLLEGLCSSPPYRFEFSVLDIFAGRENLLNTIQSIDPERSSTFKMTKAAVELS